MLNRSISGYLPITEIRAIGGAARSSLWLQIKADVLGKTITVPKTLETSSLGSVLIAGVSSEVFPNLSAASEKFVRIDYRVEPNKNNYEIYKHAYDLYRKVYKSMGELFTGNS